ncbi:hypothetical protein BDU57DRAFT_521369 [Ampelomyces quisqualis]|uniref:Uncharacterized protein n=1 Tax=Ampelomyces quisqualis TaxID=50730 RepID=A0A6A5QB20_AMPQU|nr:hypothetical protein BDU57DRAFT_521369 [Ampelomyces quisqualis]
MSSYEESICDGPAHKGDAKDLIAINLVSSRQSTTKSRPERITVPTPPRLTTTAAIGAAAIYYTTSSSSSEASPAPSQPTQTVQDKSAYNRDEAPKPVEDRHGDTVEKHGIAARKNQNKVREGKFSGQEFDNHVQAHTPGSPGGDFEKRS